MLAVRELESFACVSRVGEKWLRYVLKSRSCLGSRTVLRSNGKARPSDSLLLIPAIQDEERGKID